MNERIFISHSFEDMPLARSLSAALVEAGYDVFHAAEPIVPGQNWRTILDETLRESDAIVALISENFSHSRGAMMELGAALAYSRESGKPIILPVLVGEAQLPPDLSH